MGALRTVMAARGDTLSGLFTTPRGYVHPPALEAIGIHGIPTLPHHSSGYLPLRGCTAITGVVALHILQLVPSENLGRSTSLPGFCIPQKRWFPLK